MENLIARIRRMAFILILGVCLIIYIGVGIVYVQQWPKQKDLQDQINKTFLVVSKPLPSMEKLQANYDEVNHSLSPLAIPEALEVVVNIAKENGIDVDPASGKFNIPPPPQPGEKKLGEGTYQILRLNSIKVQGDHESVMAFISDLDSGKTVKTMVLNRVETKQVEIKYGDEETARRAEFRAVSSAVIDLMVADNITEIPNPINYDGGVAINDMAAFPDITTTAAEKGYTGTGTPKDGYVLYQHDRIPTDNTTDFETVNYISTQITQYYYTCETDGSVRQFDGADLATATEYFGTEAVKLETVAILNIDFYTKPIKG